MNELIFILHIFSALFFLGVAVRLGKMALGVYIALSGVLANLFVVKQIELFGFHVTASDVFAVGGILGLNLLQEIYGSEEAKKAVRASLAALILFACMSQVHLLYSPSTFDSTHGSFVSILSSAPRIVAASIGVYYLVQRLDVLFFKFMRTGLKHFGIRVLFSLLISQALDTVLFSFFGLYGIVESLADIMILSYAVKCAIIACSSSLALLLKRFHKEENEALA